MLKIIFLISALFLNLASALAFAQFSEAASRKVTTEYKQFMAMAGRVARQEPELISNPTFDQKLTMKYQRYGGSQEVTQFKMIFSVAPSAVKLDRLAKAYLKYANEANSLSDELPVFVKNHLAMITDADYAASYKKRYEEVLKTLFPDSNGKLREFKVFDCDYVTQPTDGLWYTVHAMRLLDEYGTSLYGLAWETKRDALVREHKLRSMAEMQSLVAPTVSSKAPDAPSDLADEPSENSPAK
jgi:hypothetical protein